MNPHHLSRYGKCPPPDCPSWSVDNGRTAIDVCWRGHIASAYFAVHRPYERAPCSTTYGLWYSALSWGTVASYERHGPETYAEGAIQWGHGNTNTPRTSGLLGVPWSGHGVQRLSVFDVPPSSCVSCAWDGLAWPASVEWCPRWHHASVVIVQHACIRGRSHGWRHVEPSCGIRWYAMSVFLSLVDSWWLCGLRALMRRSVLYRVGGWRQNPHRWEGDGGIPPLRRWSEEGAG